MGAPPAIPALPDTDRIVSYSISASTGPLAVPFALYGDGTDFQNWLQVWFNGSQIAYNDSTYGWNLSSPSGTLGTLPLPITDAIISFNAVQTGSVTIVGARRPRRISQFAENRGVAARDLNQTVTDLVAQNREFWDLATERTLIVPGGETVTTIAKQSVRAGKILGFDGSGNPTTIAATISGTAAVTSLTLTRAQIPSVIPTGSTIILSGYAAANDKGSGAVMTSVGATSGGPAAIQDLGGTWWNLVLIGLPVSVGWFGAVGNGVANDTAAIAAAITACANAGGGVVTFPTGVYLINATITVPNKVSLLGVGGGDSDQSSTPPITELKWNGASGGTMFDFDPTHQNWTGFIRGICFTGNFLAGTALKLHAFTKSILDDVYVKTCAVGGTAAGVNSAILIDIGTASFPASLCTLRNVTVDFLSGGNALTAHNMTSMLFDTCKFVGGTNMNAVLIDNASDTNVFVNCAIQGQGASGFCYNVNNAGFNNNVIGGFIAGVDNLCGLIKVAANNQYSHIYACVLGAGGSNVLLTDDGFGKIMFHNCNISTSGTTLNARGELADVFIFTIANGQHIELVILAGLIAVSDSTNNTGLYLVGGALTATMIASVGTTWVAPTTSPTSGKASVAFDGAAIAIYNNTGSTSTFTVSVLETI